MKHWKACSLIVLAIAAFSACGNETAADGRRRIAVIPKGTTHEFWKSIHAGALQAARELDVEIFWKGPLREDDRDEQVKVVEDFITRGVDGIVLAPMDDTALAPPLEDAAGQGIPVAIIDSDVRWDGRISFIATDNHAGGVLGAKRLAELLGGDGRVIMMRYLEGSASTMKREAGFLETIESEYPDIEVLSSNQHAGATTEGAYSTAENLLVSFPDVEGIFCPNESAVFGMLRALQDAGRAGEVFLVGFDPSAKLAAALRDGEVHGLVLQNPFAMGEIGVRTMMAHLDGASVEKRIDTGVTMATQDNMDDPAIAKLLFPDLSLLDE